MKRLFVTFAVCASFITASTYAITYSAPPKKINCITCNQWPGQGIAYGPYRDGESPAKNSLTSEAHILEDLKLITPHWQMIRLYGSGKLSQRVLKVIKQHQVPIKVMLGAWISKHQSTSENDIEVDNAIAIAKQFPDIVVAVNIGNEIFVDWSAHRITDIQSVIRYLRKTRAAITQPVTVNDDYNFWNKPQAKQIADEVDFIGLHAYAFWNNQTIDQALSWTQNIYANIQARFPNKQIVYTETGWPTSRVYDDSYEGKLVGKANEKNQRLFFDAFDTWTQKEKIVSFYFEAFDEKWKGGFDGENPMAKAEKHWGMFYSNRKPKAALQKLPAPQ